MTDRQIDELIDRALREDCTPPEGLGTQLERQIDAWAASAEGRAKRRYRPAAIRIAAAAVVAAVTTISILDHRHDTSTYATGTGDTFDTPEEAAAFIAHTLHEISGTLHTTLNAPIFEDLNNELNNINGIFTPLKTENDES